MNFKVSRLTSGLSSLFLGGTTVTLGDKKVGTLRASPGLPPDIDFLDYHPDDAFLHLKWGTLTLKGGGQVVVVLKNLGGDSVPSKSGKEDRIWREVSHQNILPLLGEAWFSLGPGHRPIKFLVSAFQYNGNIVHYLRKNPSEYNERRLDEFIVQMLAGLVYLHGRNYSHADFKLDNVLINDSHEAVICDFGLSTEIVRGPNHLPTTDYVRSLGPKRYHSAEILNLGVKMVNATVPLASVAGDARPRSTPPPVLGKSPCRKSPESDMWAVGMAILHLYSGQWPWQEVENEVDIRAYIHRGLRPQFPAESSACKMPVRVWKQCGDCWEQLPRHRPTSTQLMRRFTGTTDTPPASGLSREELCDFVERELNFLTGEVAAVKGGNTTVAPHGVVIFSGVWSAPEGDGDWGTPVSLKRYESTEGLSDGWTTDLLVELFYWRHLRHQALMPLIGACRIDGWWHAVFPETKKSQWFRHYITQVDEEHSLDPTLPNASRLKMLLDISGALSFMHSQDPPFAHGAVHLDNVYVGTVKFRGPKQLTIDACLCDFRHVTLGDRLAIAQDLRDFGELMRNVLEGRHSCTTISESPLLENEEVVRVLRLCSLDDHQPGLCATAEEIRAVLRVLAEESTKIFRTSRLLFGA